MNKQTESTEPVNPENGFMVLLQHHRGGGCLGELTERLAQVVAGVFATGKPGSLTLKLAIKPASKGVNAAIVIDQIDDKTPQEEVEASFWYMTDEGRLQRTDPRQREMKFASVPSGKMAAAGETDTETRAAAAQ